MSTPTPTVMRRVVVHADRIEVVSDAAVPLPRPHEALVRSVIAGVCGSDTHAAHGQHPFIPAATAILPSSASLVRMVNRSVA